jgi:DNA helicase-2/ATP-dependent DNA helicase PcrA
MTTASGYRPIGKQQDVCDSQAPTLLVLGGAGTGKTVTAAAAARAHLLRRDALAQPRAARERVLFLTFSRTAVSQILSRSRGVLGEVASRVDVFIFHGWPGSLFAILGAMQVVVLVLPCAVKLKASCSGMTRMSCPTTTCYPKR